MGNSIFLKQSDMDLIGQVDWWPVEIVANSCRRAIGSMTNFGQYYPTKERLIPILYVKGIADLAAMVEHAKVVPRLVLEETENFKRMLATPGVLGRRPERSVIDAIGNVADYSYEAAKRIRSLAAACVESIVIAKDVAKRPPEGLDNLVLAWNHALLSFANDFVKCFDTIPDQLDEILRVVRSGPVVDGRFDIVLNAHLELKAVNVAVELMQALEEQARLENAIREYTAAAPGAGKVYVLLNPSMPGLVKIGKTKRDSENRANELHTTGVPTPFIVIYEVLVEDCDACERRVHEFLSDYRVSNQREFFRVEPKIAIDAVMAHSKP